MVEGFCGLGFWKGSEALEGEGLGGAAGLVLDDGEGLLEGAGRGACQGFGGVPLCGFESG